MDREWTNGSLTARRMIKLSQSRTSDSRANTTGSSYPRRMFEISKISVATMFPFVRLYKTSATRFHKTDPLVQAMNDMKERLITDNCPDIPRSAVISGYHRGRRPLLGQIYFPDIVSIHHLHLHVVVRPRLLMWLFKYPSWLPLLWKSDVKVTQEVRRLT